MRIAFIIILIFAFASGCVAGEKSKEKVETVKSDTTLEPPDISINTLEEYPLGDYGKAKNVTLLFKEIKKGEKSYYYYQAIYHWRGLAYRTGTLNLVYPEKKDIPSLAPPKTPGEAYGHAFQWIRNNTPEDAVFLSWWDYGDFIRFFGQRDALVSDPCPRSACLETLGENEKDVYRYEDEARFKDVVRFFTSNEDVAYKIAKKYGVDYVFVTYEDFPKSWAINYLGGKDDIVKVFTLNSTDDKKQDMKKIAEGFAAHRVSAYFAREEAGKYTVWYLLPEDVSKIRERLLLSLLPLKGYPGNINTRDMLSNFKLVYQDDTGYIYIFKVT
jgi:hydroxylamine oxidation protein HaoB